MTDKCDAEIKAIENCFTGEQCESESWYEAKFIYNNLFFIECRVLICDFHLEQAWEKRVKRKENDIGSSKEQVLALKPKIAKAESEEELIEAMNNFKESPFWIGNLKRQKYVDNIWLAEKEVRILIYLQQTLA